jgi:hypothetical protein
MSREGNPPIPEQHSTAAIPCIAVVQGLKIPAPASAGERYSVRAQWTEWVATSTDASRAAGEPEQCRSTSFCWLLFPLIYGLISVSSNVLFASCGRWGRRHLRSSINLTNWLDGWLVLRLVRLAVPLRDRCARRPSDASVRRKPAAPALAARRSPGIPCIAMILLRPGAVGVGPVSTRSHSMGRTRPWLCCDYRTCWLSPHSRSAPRYSGSSSKDQRSICWWSAAAIRFRYSRLAQGSLGSAI